MSEEYEKPHESGYTVYTKSGCPNCSKVKNYLKNAITQLVLVDCDEYLIENKTAFLKFIEEFSGFTVKFFPIVFYEGKYIGGLTETEKHCSAMIAFSNIYF